VIAELLVALAVLVGNPVRLDCTDAQPPGYTPPPGTFVEGWTTVGDSSVVHLSEVRCTGLRRPPSDVEWAWSVQVLLHEAAHASGIRNEACAEAFTFIWALWLLPRLGIPWEPTLERMDRRTASRPSSYHPHFGSCAELLA
jgi:hypothetical protein